MPDRDNVIDGLDEICHYDGEQMFYNDIFIRGIAGDALALLKEQEAVELYSMNAERTYGICPKCGKIVFRYGNVEENHYCGVCGQAVKWE